MQWVGIWGDHAKRIRQVAPLPLLLWMQMSAQLASWSLAQSASLCENQWNHICAAPRCSLGTTLSKREVLSWCCLPNLSRGLRPLGQLNQAVRLCRVLPVYRQDQAGGGRDGQELSVCVCVCVCVLKLDQSTFLLCSVLEIFYWVGDKEALCAVQSVLSWYTSRINPAQSYNTASGSNPRRHFQCLEMTKDGWQDPEEKQWNPMDLK